METSCKLTAAAKHPELNISSRREKAIQPIPARVVSMPGSDALQNSTGATVKGHVISNRNLGRGFPSPFNNLAKLFDEEEGELIIAKNLRNCENALMYGFFGFSRIADLLM